jgi:hypothetical protein
MMEIFNKERGDNMNIKIPGRGLYCVATIILLMSAITGKAYADWTVTGQAELNGAAYATLELGTRAGATDNYDAGIDQLAPPTPPAPDDNDVFFSSVTNEFGFERLWKDFRGTLNTAKTWRLEMQVVNTRTMTVSFTGVLPEGWEFKWQEADVNSNGIGAEHNLSETITVANNTGVRLTKKFLIKVFLNSFEKGDINEDGEVNISDVILCLRIAIGLPVTINGIEYTHPNYTPHLLKVADMNSDGEINIQDVILVLRKAIGL